MAHARGQAIAESMCSAREPLRYDKICIFLCLCPRCCSPRFALRSAITKLRLCLWLSPIGRPRSPKVTTNAYHYAYTQGFSDTFFLPRRWELMPVLMHTACPIMTFLPPSCQPMHTLILMFISVPMSTPIAAAFNDCVCPSTPSCEAYSYVYVHGPPDVVSSRCCDLAPAPVTVLWCPRAAPLG